MNEIILNEDSISNKIYIIRNKQVMLDRDLAQLYGVETRVINQAVKRNIERFDEEDFVFRLTKDELDNWKSQNVISNSIKMGLRKPPLAFTEQGVYMLATVLKSKTAVTVTKQIMKTFVKMRQFLLNNASIFQRFENIEYKLSLHDKELEEIFELLKQKDIPNQGVFFDGQIWDAYEFINTLLKKAKKEVVLIDNYIDDSVLTIFSKYSNLNFTIITKSVSKQLNLDIKKYNSQYNNLKVKTSNRFHDRFLIIDNTTYHIGASLKDLGKKVFGFSKIDIDILKDIK